MDTENPYVPGTAPMPAFPPNYRPPLAASDNPAIQPEGDIERLVGGDVFCRTYLERDMIPAVFRTEGITEAYVREPSAGFPGDSFWYLRGGITNQHWVEKIDAGRGTSTAPAIIRGGNADPENFQGDARYVLY